MKSSKPRRKNYHDRQKTRRAHVFNATVAPIRERLDAAKLLGCVDRPWTLERGDLAREADPSLVREDARLLAPGPIGVVGGRVAAMEMDLAIYSARGDRTFPAVQLGRLGALAGCVNSPLMVAACNAWDNLGRPSSHAEALELGQQVVIDLAFDAIARDDSQTHFALVNHVWPMLELGALLVAFQVNLHENRLIAIVWPRALLKHQAVQHVGEIMKIEKRLSPEVFIARLKNRVTVETP